MSGPAPFSFGELIDLLRGRQVADAPCPLCSPHRKPINRSKPVLRLWRIDERLISYYCVHCEASGCVMGGRRAAPDRSSKSWSRRNGSVRRCMSRRLPAAQEGTRHLRAPPAHPRHVGRGYFRDHRRITCKLPETMGFLPGDGRYPPAIVMPFGLAPRSSQVCCRSSPKPSWRST